MGLTNAHDYEPLWQAHLAEKRRVAKAKSIYGRNLRGESLGDITDLITGATAAIPTLATILQDPALPTVVDRVNTILSFTPPSTSPSGSSTPPGLAQFIPYLNGYIYYLQNPILLPIAIGAFVLLIGGIGYKLGKR